MKKIYNPERNKWEELLRRPAHSFERIEATVNQVFREVRSTGDPAIARYTELFDGVTLDSMEVTREEITEASSRITPELKEAISLARQNIERFHQAQQTGRIHVETMPGVECWQEKRPIQKVGFYIPGGTAPLFSTILMLAIPARIAGCREIIMCTPPDKNGRIDPAVLYTAGLCGITRIFRVGGIQAIAGMTFGTRTIPKVYKIFGPGNQYVTVAKQLATRYDVAIDMPAGPSELLVMADASARASFVAADLLSQAEHGTDSQVILVSTSRDFLQEVEQELELQLSLLQRRDLAATAIEHSRLIYMERDEEALELINQYAPEHFIICTRNEEFYINGIHNAGSVFIGNYTPESAGDYASGTNHTLPTGGFAKQYSGVNLDSFTKAVTFQKITREGLEKIGPAIELMAEAEGLGAHRNAVSLRLKNQKE